MPSFELQSPDGKVFEVEAPDARTAAAAFAKMSTGGSSAGPDVSAEAAREAAAARMVRGVRRENLPGNEFSRMGGAIDAGIRMAANGATFGLADKFAGGMDYLTGQSPSYDAGVRAQRGQTEAIREANPVAAGVAEAVGGLGSGVGLMKSGVTLAGRVGSGLLPRVLGFGVEGAGYGAAQGAGNTYSDNVADYLKNAGTGAAIGSAVGAGLPVVGSAAGAAYRTGAAFLGPRVAGAGRGASALLRGAAMADEAGLRNLGQLGPEAMLPDAGPAMLGLAQGAGTGTGAGRSQLIGALESRDRGTAQRLAQSLDQNLGPAPIPSQVETGLKSSRSSLSPQYETSLENASAVDTKSIVDKIDSMIPNVRGEARSKLLDVRNDLMITDTQGNTHVPDPHPRALLATRQSIDGLTNSTQDGNVQRVLGEVRKLVDAELGAKAPNIKALDANYQSLRQQSDALEKGQSVLDGGKSAIRPVELVSMMRAGGAPQGAMVGPSAAPSMLRQGVRADIDRRVGTNINDLTALERTFATPQDWNYQKLGTVFGEGPRDRVAADISANRRFRDTYQKVAQNSQSAQRLEAAKSMEGAAGGNIPENITGVSLGLKAINGIAKILSGQSNATTRDEVGRLLARHGPEANRLARMLLDSAQTTGSNARAIAALISSPEWIAATAPAYGRR